jgi:hypothetical protein
MSYNHHSLTSDVLAAMSPALTSPARHTQAGYLLHTPGDVPVDSLTPDQALTMITQVSSLPGAEDTVAPDSSPLVAAKQRAQGVATSLQTYEQYLHMMVLAACAATTVRTTTLPPKLNAIIQPLMAAARKEPEAALQVCEGVMGRQPVC